jgi:hypothetical protein
MNNELKSFYQYLRTCDKCRKSIDAAYFPSLTKELCIWCYEKKHKKTLHKMRKRLELPDQSPFKKDLIKQQCPNCGSKRTRKARLKEKFHKKYFCKECQYIWEAI